MKRKPELFWGARAAISLIEMLIVMGIIVVLAAILIPSIDGMAKRGKEVRCLSNLKNIGAANIAYAQENQGMVIVGSNGDPNYWWIQIRPYLDVEVDFNHYDLDNRLDTLICPADPSLGGADSIYGYYLMQRRSYAINRVTAPWSSELGKNAPVRLQSVPAPSRMAYCGDYDWQQLGTDWIDATPDRINLVPKNRHHGRANFVFLDGHTEALKISDLYPGGSKHYIFQAQES